MSQVRPKIDGWIGYGDGASVLVATGTPLDSDHPVVLERPELFEKIDKPAPAPVKRSPGRPPKPAASDGDA